MQVKFMNQFEKQAQETVIRNSLATDPNMQFNNPKIYTYQKKLEQLYEFEDELLREDRVMKENRRGLQTICRMKGSNSQSYFLYDSQDLQVAREIRYELIDAENNYQSLGLHPVQQSHREYSRRRGTQ